MKERNKNISTQIKIQKRNKRQYLLNEKYKDGYNPKNKYKRKIYKYRSIDE